MMAMFGQLGGELILFTSCMLLLGGLNELAIDLLYGGWWLTRNRRLYVKPAARVARIAIFVPACNEAGVIRSMLATARARYGEDDYIIFVGCYAQDHATQREVAGVAQHDQRVQLRIAAPGLRSTKGDCLNGIWRAMLDYEAATRHRFEAVLLHDAEDLVDRHELALIGRHIAHCGFVQTPVVPLIPRGSRWIGGHYADEFAEAHGRTLIVRQWIGAAIPAAGVGCAFARDVLAEWAIRRPEGPFDADCLTEDYEQGLRLHARGVRGAFLRERALPQTQLIATRALFPDTFGAAVRQKSRWIAGISLAGWDRLGWSRSPAENWMRMRDRSAPLAALVLVAAYVSLGLMAIDQLMARVTGQPLLIIGSLQQRLIMATCALMLWRLAIRALFVARLYGAREGFYAVPRCVIGNMIAICAAVRAVHIYARQCHTGQINWDKTAHRFPGVSVSAE